MMEGSIVAVQGRPSGFDTSPTVAGEGRPRPGARGQSPTPREWHSTRIQTIRG